MSYYELWDLDLEGLYLGRSLTDNTGHMTQDTQILTSDKIERMVKGALRTLGGREFLGYMNAGKS